MNKCLECRNYIKVGKSRHKCSCFPRITVFVDGFPSDPIKEDCGKFDRIKEKHQTASGFRGQK